MNNALQKATLKVSPFTKALTRELKKARFVICQIDDTSVYVSDGIFIVKLHKLEYEAFVQPVTKREAGNFVVEKDVKGVRQMDLRETMERIRINTTHDLEHIPIQFAVNEDRMAAITPFYSEDGDFVAGINNKYFEMFRENLIYKSGGETSPMVIYQSKDEPVAAVCTIRLTDGYPKIPIAVRAWWTDVPPTKQEVDARIQKLETERDALQSEYADLQRRYKELGRDREGLHQEYDRVCIELDRLKLDIEQQKAYIERQKSEH